MVHTFFKENGEYKVRLFFCTEGIFNDPIKVMEGLVDEYEKENNCSLGESREIKLLRLPQEFLERKNVTVFENKLNIEDVEEISKNQTIVEI